MAHKPPKPGLSVWRHLILVSDYQNSHTIFGEPRKALGSHYEPGKAFVTAGSSACLSRAYTLVKMSMRRNLQIRIYCSYYMCLVLYLDVVRITSGCISNVKVDKVKNHHFGIWLGDDPLTGFWVRGHPGVIRWMYCACSRQGTSTGCQETPRISTCDKWLQRIYHNDDVWCVSNDTTKLEKTQP